jgi:orotate phosphoribosyltransferase
MSAVLSPTLHHATSHDIERDRSTLFALIKQRSFGLKDVTLASGRKSHFYFDMKPTMFHPQGAALLARLLFDEVKNIGADYVGGLEMGAVPVTSAVCQLSFERGHPIKGFFVRKKPKDYGAKKLIEGLDPTESLESKRVIILEDVTTTGESALKAVEACRDAGADVVMILTLVDRQEGARETIEKTGLRYHALFTAAAFLKEVGSSLKPDMS